MNKTQYIPYALRRAYERELWPVGRLEGMRFPAIWNRFQCDLELTATLADIEADASNIASIQSIRGYNRTEWHLYESSSGELHRPLPWIDLDSATCIGGGADYGDDLWLVLDLRVSQDDPPVLYNLFTSHSPLQRVEWLVAAPTLTDFLALARR